MALVQLMLFAMSSSTMMLPCAPEAVTAASAAILAPHGSVPMHAAHHDMQVTGQRPVTGSDAPSQHGSTPAHTACPWVVGCVGMVRVDLDAPWNTVENALPSVSPVGTTLRRVIVDRDVESPPPRG